MTKMRLSIFFILSTFFAIETFAISPKLIPRSGRGMCKFKTSDGRKNIRAAGKCARKLFKNCPRGRGKGVVRAHMKCKKANELFCVKKHCDKGRRR